MDSGGYITSCSDVKLESKGGVPVKKVRIYMNSRGCRYAKRKECIMCGIFNMSKENLSIDDIVNSFQKEFRKYNFDEYPILSVYAPGSFLDKDELPLGARDEVLREVGKTRGVKMLIIETRPEFVTKNSVGEVTNSIPGKELTIGIGLESSNDYVRNKCINKGFSWKDYLRAAKIATERCNLRTYILFKPPFLTEEEAKKDAIKSIEDAFSAGSESVSIEICNVLEGTPVEALYDMGQYKPARLWSVIDVLSRFEGKRVFIGGINDYPPPKAEAGNCKLCTEKVKEELIRYNSTLNQDRLKKLDCECRHKYS